MAFVATVVAAEPRSHSVGPWKVQYFNFSLASGDTSGTITADRLVSAQHVVVHGVGLTAAPTFSGNVVTLAFADPAATRFGMAIVYGK